jgi:Concanavalin A-like lectin/glucanases superfamily
MSAAPASGDTFLLFNGSTTRIDIASRAEYSQPTQNALTVSAWVRRDVADFPNFEQNHYVHWMGKGDGVDASGRQEWACRMYSLDTSPSQPRPDRISFYVFNPEGHLGTGSHVQEPINMDPPEWIHIVGVVDGGCTHIFKNGVFKDCDIYRASNAAQCVGHIGSGPCDPSSDPVVPVAGGAPLRIGTQNLESFFLGGITRVRIWGRVLTDDEILALYESDIVPADGLVAEFLLNADTGAVAIDSSTLANNGCIVDGTWAIQS